MEKEVRLVDIYRAYEEYQNNCVAYQNGDYTYLYEIEAKKLIDNQYTLKRSGKNEH